MARLTRAQAQECNRAKVLAAARDEFTERGFRDAKIDVIADRADLTRGGVYSNFPGKRALYFAVLADLAEHAPVPPHARPGDTARTALGALARAWVARLDDALLHADLFPEIVADESVRRAFTNLMRLNALLLGRSLELLDPPPTIPGAPPARRVRQAETVLTTLHGASRLAAAAPGFGEPFDVISACEQLAGLALNDYWPPPHHVPHPHPTDRPWTPPPATDLVQAEPLRTEDGVLVIVGLHRAAAVEEAVRHGEPVTAVLVTHEPAELMPLARLVLAELCGCLRQAFRPGEWPDLRVVCDESGALAAAAGVPAVSNETESAIRVAAGRIVAHAEGPGAAHAVAAVNGFPSRELRNRNQLR